MFGRRSQLTIDALAILVNRQAGSAAPLHAREIFREANIPARYLEPSLQRLVKANILDGVRGPKGGYRLVEGWQTISLAKVLEAIDDSADGPSNVEVSRPNVRSLFDRLGARWYSELVSIQLTALIEGV